MLKILLAVTAAGLLFTAHAATLFGAVVDKTAAIPVEQLLMQPASYLDKVVTISGKINSVCSKQGCWMKFTATSALGPFRIKVRDGEMVFPLSAKAKQLTPVVQCGYGHKAKMKPMLTSFTRQQ